MTLENLKASNYVSTTYETIDSESSQICEIRKLNEVVLEPGILKDKLVVVNNFKWVAVNRLSDGTFDYVLSANDTELATWQKSTLKFTYLAKYEAGLVPVKETNFNKRQKLGGKGTMDATGDINVDDFIKDMNVTGEMDSFNAQMDEFKDEAAQNEEKPAGGNSTGEPHVDTPEEIARKEAKLAFEKQIEGIREKLVGEVDNNDLNLFNQSLGRLQGFVTKNDAAIKVTKKTEPLKVNGKYVCIDGIDPAIEKEYLEKNKKPSASYLKKETKFKLTHAKPSDSQFVLLTIPEGGDVPVSSLTSAKIEPNRAKLDLVAKTLDTETAYQVINGLFGGKIKEDIAVLNERAGTVSVNARYSTKTKKDSKTGETKTENIIRTSFKLGKDAGRATLITADNYVPINVYSTAPMQNISEELSSALNGALKKSIKDKSDYDKLSAADQANITYNAVTGDVSYNIFAPGKGQVEVEVATFYDSKQILSTLNIPVRTAVEKDGKTTFPFLFFPMVEKKNPSVVNPLGSLAKPEFQNFLKRAKRTPESLIKDINSIRDITKETSATVSKTAISPREYILLKSTKKELGVTFSENSHDLAAIDSILMSQRRN